jgi:fatty acid desaturase
METLTHGQPPGIVGPRMAAPLKFEEVDSKAFARDLDELRAEIDASLSPRDLRHLYRGMALGRISTLLGYLTAWIAPNPLSAVLLGVGSFVRWAAIAHHIAHRGYDKVPGAPAWLSGRRFAHGWRRIFQWFDWMPPEAWIHEHNTVHHAVTCEEADPDLVERNLDVVRRIRAPMAVKYLVLAFFMCTWRLTYFMPSVLRSTQHARLRRAGTPSPDDSNEALFRFWNPFDAKGRAQWWRMLNPLSWRGREYWLSGVLYFFVVRFVAIPLLFLPLGKWAVLSVFINTVLGDVVANIQSFITITPNHTGDDLPIYDAAGKGRAEYYLRQAFCSVNYTSPNEFTDWMHGGLNLHIEHHLWPDLPLSKYREYAPRVRAICEKHGVPYREEPVMRRFAKMVDVFVGKTSMEHVGRREKVLANAA